MLMKIAIRVAATFATIIGFGVLRLILVYSLMHNSGHRPARAAGGAAEYGANPTLPPDHSGWVVFSSADPRTGATIRHARLMEFVPAPAPDAGDGADAQPPAPLPSPRGSLELRRQGIDGHQALISLRPHNDCAGITTISAQFDRHAARDFAVVSNPQASPRGALCELEIQDYDSFLQAVRDADMLSVHDKPTKPAAAAIQFAVGGLSWD